MARGALVYRWLVLFSGALAWGLPTTAQAQLAAFPGAEGAGMFATGGRGGDIYFVTNLNDSGAGSLRNGISTAPAAGRTIVFNVSGTIHLASNLTINKSKLTIAGQTAPGGGITLADRQATVSNAQDVILQYLRFRPGDTFTQPTNPTGYGPDSLGVTNSSNVMIDHVTASWSVDEVLSVTSNSNNVTVQYSMISEALHNANHPDGGDHSFGALINGGDITYAHNLFASNRSRNPRPQGAASTSVPGTLRLDFVNNVIENPGDRYGYSGNNVDSNDDYSMNFVNNYGIKGPHTTATALFVPASTATEIFAPAGSFIDDNTNGVLDGAVASGNKFINGTRTNLAARIGLPQVTTYDANRAYVEALSRAGANFYRDPVDRRIIRSVMNQTGTASDSQTQVKDPSWPEAWPPLPSGTPPVDSNADGVPNYFALENGFNTTQNIRNTLHRDGSGYTYMEKYLQSLTPNSFAAAPAALQIVTVPTSFGRGADAQINENGGSAATSSGNGLGTALNAQWSGVGGTTNQAIILKFDLSQIKRGTATDATLQLTVASAISGTHNFNVYGVEQDATGWNWSEASIQFNDAPGVTYDSNSGTLGVDPNNPNTPGVLTLGTFSIGTTPAGGTVNFTNPNLAVFLNLAAYFQGAAQDNLVTILLEQTNNASAAGYYSKEAGGTLAPRLLVSAMLSPLLGDFNRDMLVSNADIQAMLEALKDLSAYQTSRGLSDDDLLTIADFNADGLANVADVPLLLTQLTSAGQNLAVPEPSALALLAIGGMVFLRRHS